MALTPLPTFPPVPAGPDHLDHSTKMQQALQSLHADVPAEVAEVSALTAQHADLDGTSGTYLRTADAANVAGDLDVRLGIVPADWSAAASQTLVSKYQTVAGGRSFELFVTTEGRPSLNVSLDGSAFEQVFASTLGAIETASWLRVTRDATTGTVRFFISNDDPATDPAAVSWTQLGTDLSTAAGTLHATAAELAVGARSGGTVQRTSGKVFQAQVLDGATTVAHLDLTDTGQWAEGATGGTDGAGNVWTLTGELVAETFVVNGTAVVTAARFAAGGGGGGVVWSETEPDGNVLWVDPTAAEPPVEPSAAQLLSLGRVAGWDTFDRPDSTVGTSDSGHVWTVHAGTWTVASNRLRVSVGAGNAHATIDPLTSGNGVVECDVMQVGSTAPGLVFRWQDVDNFLYVQLTSGFVQLYKRAAGTATSLASVAHTTDTGYFHRLAVRMVGPKIKVTVDGAAIITHTLTGGDETAFPDTLSPVGVRVNFDSTPRWDNFVVRSLS